MMSVDRLIVLLVAVSLTASCNFSDENFSQYPGFKDYFVANPPSSDRPGAEDRLLLARFRPRFWLPAPSPDPIDFYRDYIAQGYLLDDTGQIIANHVTRELLNRHKHEPLTVFVHESEQLLPHPTVYGRIEREVLPFQLDDGTSVRNTFTFLTYNVVFRQSGLSADLPRWQAVLLGLVGDLDDWHQLDHYTSVTLVLDQDDVPVAIVVQQHNYQHTYLFGEAIELPKDRRVNIDVAIRSNELYPHVAGRKVRRAVQFATRKGMRFLLGAGSRPIVSADDITESVREVEYKLEFLPPDDAFYTFEGFLGERRLLPGRDGPPGAAYNTLPILKPWSVQTFVGYWREGNRGDWQRYEESTKGSSDMRRFAEKQAQIFYHNWQCLLVNRVGCEII
ncbi:MAG: hypothetical protein ACE5G5_04635 [Candidatus Methylomirabilales bacterium]